MNNPGTSYVAAIIGGKVETEEASQEKLTVAGSFRSRNSIYNLQISNGIGNKPSSSILIENAEYSRNKKGLNVVVYDIATCKVIDRVTLSGEAIKR